ncbi:MAG: sulfite exporter TauE/SafE family protein [Candidatus Izemoplasmataceae bacterium]
MTFELVLYGGIIMLFSAFMKGITGFGTALFAMPLLTAFFFAPEEARPVIVSINLMLNFFILFKERNFTYENFRALAPLVISGFVFAVLSGFVLSYVDFRLFSILLGSLLILTALNKLLNLNFTIQRYKRFFLPIGTLGGILNTLIGAGGVPVLIFLSNTPLKKEAFRTSLLLFFFAINTGAIISFVAFDNYPVSSLSYIALFFPFVMVGSILGMKAVSRINNTLFQRIVAVLLLFMGLDSLFNIL